MIRLMKILKEATGTAGAGDSDNGGQWGAPGKVRKLRGFELPRGWAQIDNGPKADDPFGKNTEYRKDTHDIEIPGGYYDAIETDDFVTAGIGIKGKDFVQGDANKSEYSAFGKSMIDEFKLMKLKTILKELAISDPIKQVAGILVKYKDEFLLLKRTDNELWAMPAGHVHKDEMPITGAIRELSEETGILASREDLKLIARVLTKGYSIFSIYLYDIDEKIEPKKLDGEHSEWGYFTVDNLPQPLMLGVEGVIKRALES